MKKESLQKTESVPADAAVTAAAEVYAFPASPQQVQFWFLDQLEPGNPAYNIPLAYELRGELSLVALETAFSWALNRHETFRTRLVLNGEQLQQVVDPERSFALQQMDVRMLPPADRDAKCQALIAEEAAARFDLAAGPLARGLLILLESRRQVVMFNFHHAILDHLSVLQFAREFCTAYAAFRRGEAPELAPPVLHYPDFSVWQEEQMREPAFQDDLGQWVNRLADAPALLDLPLDRPRATIQSFAGQELKFSLPAPLSARIRELARSSRKSVYVTLLTAFKCLLARYAAQEDIVVGSPFSNRTVGELEGVMGCCMNTLPLYSKLGTARTFRDALEVVQQTVIEAHTRQRVPLKAIVDASQLERNPGVNPFFQVLLVVQDPPMTLQFEDIEVRPLAVHNGTSKFDISVWLWDAQGQISGLWEYNTELFDQGTVERMVRNFESFLEALVSHPDGPLRQLPLLSAPENRLLLQDWNATEVDLPATGCVTDLALAQAARTPEAVAVVSGKLEVSYSELVQRSSVLAEYLVEIGVEADSRVAICLDRSVNQMVAVLAVLQAGGAYVPLDPAYPAERLAFMLDDSGALAVVTESRHTGLFVTGRCKKVLLDSYDWTPRSQSGPPSINQRATPESLAYVIYTSGSTGRPKGVAMIHRALVNLILWQLDASRELPPMARTIQFTSISFDVSFQEIFATWCSGGTLVLMEENLRYDPHALWRFLQGQAINRIFMPFVALQQLAEVVSSSAEVNSELRDVITAGEQLQITPSIREMFRRLSGTRLHNHYGPSETHVVTAFSLPMDIDSCTALPPIGRPVANTQIYVVNETLQLQPVGVPGELLIGGACLARGYLDRPDLTSERFISNPFGKGRLYRTGDLAKWREDGVLEWLGRLDLQVKLRGFRVELGEIESALREHPAVREAAIVKCEHQLVAYIVPAEGALPDATTFRDHLRSKLPEYMVPARFVMLERFPLTPSGKVDRKALPRQMGEAVTSGDRYASPQSDVEKRLQIIWEQALNRTNIGIHDDFFDLGGHSLLGIQLANRIGQQFGIEFTPPVLFENPTIALIARYISKLNAGVDGANYELRRRGSKNAPDDTQLGHAAEIAASILQAAYVPPIADLDLRKVVAPSPQSDPKDFYHERIFSEKQHVKADHGDPVAAFNFDRFMRVVLSVSHSAASRDMECMPKVTGSASYSMRESSFAKHVLAPMFSVNRKSLRALIQFLILKLEGRELLSVSLRKLYKKHFNMHIGDYSTRCFNMDRFKCGTRIGRYCTIFPTARIEVANHPSTVISSHAAFYYKPIGFSDGAEPPAKQITIGHDVHIGHNAIILPPCQNIGTGSVIAAGAVIAFDVPPYAVVAGNPAMIVRYRFSKATIEKLLESRWWDASLEELHEIRGEFVLPVEGGAFR